MTKHTGGKARRSGLTVGNALTAKVRQGARGGRDPKFSHFHTTEIGDNSKPTMQSVIEANDLTELMDLANLEGRDFTANRGEAIVISTGAVAGIDNERSRAERKELEDRNRHRLVVPRRPAWTPDMAPEVLDAQERAAFLHWRRDLAKLEEEERLLLTPFEKNLEVWRQLWRVVERSDVVVQVVDARDPLRYRCEDLERYAMELHETKTSILLLNKSDLLTRDVRIAWADTLDDLGLDYLFWSATRATKDVEYEKAKQKADAAGLPMEPKLEASRAAEMAERAADDDGSDPRVRIVGRDELIELLEEKAAAALEAAGPSDPRNMEEGRRRMVGLVGYPNVGKSSTINALFGNKKTAVAPTPGKTKHFQTLIVHEMFMLCDCPGLVFPTYANSKAEMVAAGVIPIDRLTDVRAPVQVVADRVGRAAFERLYGCHLPAPKGLVGTVPAPTAGEVLRAVGVLRGWVNGSGLPDETKAGRQIMKDYVDGKLLWFEYPPGYKGPRDPRLPVHAIAGQRPAAQAAAPAPSGAGAAEASGRPAASSDDEGESDEGEAGPGPSASDMGGPMGGMDLESALLAEAIGLTDKSKDRRPGYKFHKKTKRDKGTRGKGAFGISTDGGFDGAGVMYGKRGGIVRVAAPAPAAAEAAGGK